MLIFFTKMQYYVKNYYQELENQGKKIKCTFVLYNKIIIIMGIVYFQRSKNKTQPIKTVGLPLEINIKDKPMWLL